MSPNSPARGNRGREATEEALLDAFEQVLIRDGIRRLSVNAIVEAAGVGKPLLYRYFGDLAGLVRAWSARRSVWPAAADRARRTPAHEADDAFRRRVADELVASANGLRDNPASLELLAEELTASSDLSEAFGEARDAFGGQFVRTLLTRERYQRPDNRALITVLYAAVTYLAMRSRRSPRFMGLRLDTEDGWHDAMGMIREIAERVDRQGRNDDAR